MHSTSSVQLSPDKAAAMPRLLFTLPIPQFSASQSLHQDLAAAGIEAAQHVAELSFPDGASFQRAREMVRTSLLDAGISPAIDVLVDRLLS